MCTNIVYVFVYIRNEQNLYIHEHWTYIIWPQYTERPTIYKYIYVK